MRACWTWACALGALAFFARAGETPVPAGPEPSWAEIEAWALADTPEIKTETRVLPHLPVEPEVKPAEVKPPAAVAPPEAKAPVPGAKALAASELAVRQNFKLDSLKPVPADLRATAVKMLETGRSAVDLPLRYTLIHGSALLAAQAGDGALALVILDELGVTFAVDLPALKLEALTRACVVAATPPAQQWLAQAAVGLVEEVVAADNYDLAVRLVMFADDTARRGKDAQLVTRIQASVKEVRDLQAEFAKVKGARQALQEKPNDPDAALAFGRFLCFVKGDWNDGLPLLVRGADAALKSAAEKDLAAAQSIDAQLAAGDNWWDLGEKQSAAAKNRLRLRAAEWYSRCLLALDGAARTRAEERLKSLGQSVVGVQQPGNVALASNGATITGPRNPQALIDGVVTGYNGGAGFAYGNFPCEFLLTLPKVYQLREIRLLLWDQDARFYNYALEISADGKLFVPLADHSKGKWRSRQIIPVANQAVKAIKLKGLFDSSNVEFHAVELEAYCVPSLPRPLPKLPSEEK